jgi:hypothetical protein
MMFGVCDKVLPRPNLDCALRKTSGCLGTVELKEEMS